MTEKLTNKCRNKLTDKRGNKLTDIRTENIRTNKSCIRNVNIKEPNLLTTKRTIIKHTL